MDQHSYDAAQNGLLICLLGQDHHERLRAFIDGLRKDSRWKAAQISNLEASIKEALDDDMHSASESHCLSQREEQILRLLARGYTNLELAARFDLSAKTIETYKTRACRKLGLKRRTDIIRFALEHGWFDDPTDDSPA